MDRQYGSPAGAESRSSAIESTLSHLQPADLTFPDRAANWFRRPIVSATLFLTALTAMLTWPQAARLGSFVSPYPDSRLSIWRLSWLAHALQGDLRHFFDGNIFYPSTGTFAYSDATLLEGLIAAPFLWAHANPVAVYNILLLGGIVTSGIGMFVLVRYLTGNLDAALVSAVVFTMVPYRVEHFMHLELEWTVWMPLTLWAVHRTFDRGTIRAGLVTGLLLSLQVLSGVYYGVFLGMIAGTLAVLLAATRPERAARGLKMLFIGVLVPALVTAVYAQPYMTNAKTLGPRTLWEITAFSARPGSYFSAPQENWLWGWTAWQFTGNELHLFLGVSVLALAAVALVLRRGQLVWIYAALTVLALELSLGLNGSLYSGLYGHLSFLKGFRAPARFSILACCGLAVVAGLGFQAIHQRISRPRARQALLVATLVAIGVEFGSAPMRLERLSTDLPDGYKFLRSVYPSVVVELPFEDWELAPDFMYWSTYHWNPLINGYSGYHPPSYTETTERMRTFPDDESVARLKALGTRYVVVHEFYYKAAEYTKLMTAIAARPDLILVGRFKGIEGSMQILELTR
jgi:hypothetical protein